MDTQTGIKIVIDSREQRPYSFKTASETGTLQTGDYSLKGLESHVAIERKSANDLIQCLLSGRERFEKELHRGKALDYFCLVIEASLSDLANGKYKSEMLPKSAIQSLVAFSVRYHLPIFFCDNRDYGQRLTESLLLKYACEIEKQHKAVSGGTKDNG